MVTRAPRYDDVPTAKHLGGPSPEQRRSVPSVPKDDPILLAIRNARVDTRPMTDDEREAVDEFHRMRRVRDA